jgi:hypothetical protein
MHAAEGQDKAEFTARDRVAGVPVPVPAVADDTSKHGLAPVRCTEIVLAGRKVRRI